MLRELFSFLHNLLNYHAEVMTTPLPPIFENCSRAEFEYGKDEKYALCNIPLDENPCDLLSELHKAKAFRTYFLAIVPVCLSVIALLFNLVHIGLHVKLWRSESSSYKKRYLFLLSRAFSSVMALLLFYVVLICWKTAGFLYSSAMIFIFVGCLDFLTITGTYMALTSLLYMAIVHPMWYRMKLRLRHCIGAVGVIWTTALAVALCVGLWGATLFYPNSAPITCSFAQCQKPLAIVLVVGLSISYLSVLVLYCYLLLRMRRRKRNIEHQFSGNSAFSSSSIHAGTVQKHSSSTSSTPPNARRQRAGAELALRRLGWNMATFAGGSVPMLVVSIVALANLKQLSSLGEGDKSPCKTFLNSRLFVRVEILASAAAIIWLVAMILDPVIAASADPKLRGLLSRMWQRVKVACCGIRAANYMEE